MSIINEKSEVYQNCSKCSKSTNQTFKCIECLKVFCMDEVGDKVKIGKGYQLETEKCKECKENEDKKPTIKLSDIKTRPKYNTDLDLIKGFEGIKGEMVEKQKPIILMDEFERKPKETKPCLNPCPVHCKNK